MGFSGRILKVEVGRSPPLIYFLFSLCSLLLSMNLRWAQCWRPSPSEVEPPLDVDHQGGEEALEVDLGQAPVAGPAHPRRPTDL